MSLWMAFVGLAAQVLPGVLAGALGWFSEPRRAVEALNTYALKLAFPVLVVLNLMDPGFVWPTDPGFWLVVPVSALALLALVGGARRLSDWRRHAGTLALTGMFGNVAYIGLPLGQSVLGSEVRGQLTLLVAVHVTVTLLLGPWALVRWSEGEDRGGALRRVLAQPLVWSPWVGLALRTLPEAPRALAQTLFGPVAGSAGPVVLFMIGLYVWDQRRVLAGIDRVGLAHLGLKLVVFPVITLGCVAICTALGWMSDTTARMALLLSAMPTGAATFALATDLRVGEARTAQAVVGSTVLSALTLPCVAWCVG